MNKIVSLAFSLAFIGAVTVATPDAQAQKYWNQGVNQRQLKQQQRISAGVRSGALTRQEAARIQAKQVRLAYLEAQMRRSGNGLSSRERAKLQREQNQLSREIRNQSRDNQYR